MTTRFPNQLRAAVRVPCITLYNSTTTTHFKNRVVRNGVFHLLKIEQKITESMPAWRQRQSSSMTRMRFTPGKRAIYFCTFYV